MTALLWNLPGRRDRFCLPRKPLARPRALLFSDQDRIHVSSNVDFALLHCIALSAAVLPRGSVTFVTMSNVFESKLRSTIRNRMTFKGLFFRWCLLAMMLFSLLILYLYADRPALAEKFAPPYVAPILRDVLLEVVKDCDGSSTYTRNRYYTTDCTPSQTQIKDKLRQHRWHYESAELDPLLKHGESGAIAVCWLFAAVAAWNFWRWLRIQRLPRIPGAARALGRLAGLLKIDERLESRRLQKANVDFTTLKNLFDNGLITEKDFLAKKAALSSSLVGTTSRP